MNNIISIIYNYYYHYYYKSQILGLDENSAKALYPFSFAASTSEHELKCLVFVNVLCVYIIMMSPYIRQ